MLNFKKKNMKHLNPHQETITIENPFQLLLNRFSIIEEHLLEIKQKQGQLTTIEPKGKEYLTRRDVARMTSTSLTTVNQWSNEGILQRLHIGGKVLFSAKAVKEAIESGKLQKYRRA